MSGDTATWVGSIATAIGVAMAWWFAHKANRSQKAADASATAAQSAAQEHAEQLQREKLEHEERLQRIELEQAERHKREDREHAERLHREGAVREEAARLAEKNERAHRLFAVICSLPKADRGSYGEAHSKAGELYALLGSTPRSRYIVSTAMAFFAYGNEVGMPGRADALRTERDAVDRFLSGQVPELPIPTAGEVRNFTKPAPAGVSDASSLQGKAWRLRPDD